jgi:hypothetical protein
LKVDEKANKWLKGRDKVGGQLAPIEVRGSESRPRKPMRPNLAGDLEFTRHRQKLSLSDRLREIAELKDAVDMEKRQLLFQQQEQQQDQQEQASLASTEIKEIKEKDKRRGKETLDHSVSTSRSRSSHDQSSSSSQPSQHSGSGVGGSGNVVSRGIDGLNATKLSSANEGIQPNSRPLLSSSSSSPVKSVSKSVSSLRNSIEKAASTSLFAAADNAAGDSIAAANATRSDDAKKNLILSHSSSSVGAVGADAQSMSSLTVNQATLQDVEQAKERGA